MGVLAQRSRTHSLLIWGYESTKTVGTCWNLYLYKCIYQILSNQHFFSSLCSHLNGFYCIVLSDVQLVVFSYLKQTSSTFFARKRSRGMHFAALYGIFLCICPVTDCKSCVCIILIHLYKQFLFVSRKNMSLQKIILDQLFLQFFLTPNWHFTGVENPIVKIEASTFELKIHPHQNEECGFNDGN